MIGQPEAAVTTEEKKEFKPFIIGEVSNKNYCKDCKVKIDCQSLKDSVKYHKIRANLTTIEAQKEVENEWGCNSFRGEE